MHRLLVAAADVAYLLAVLLRPYMLPADPVLFSNAAGSPSLYEQPASSSPRPTYPAGSRKHTHNAAGRPGQSSHAASSLKTYMNSASRLVDVTPFTPHLQDERRGRRLSAYALLH